MKYMKFKLPDFLTAEVQCKDFIARVGSASPEDLMNGLNWATRVGKATRITIITEELKRRGVEMATITCVSSAGVSRVNG